MSEGNRIRRNMSTVFNDQDSEIYTKYLTSLDSITVLRSPTTDDEVSVEKYNDDELDKNTVVRFKQSLQNYLKVTVENTEKNSYQMR